ncbi:MAG: nitrate- and nitrite sensing domain-containing protein, partial [Pseudomonadota bacterium]
MRLSSLSIAWRIGIAVAAPIVAMLVFASLYTQQYFNVAERMKQVQSVVGFSTDISRLVHELQRERGRSAGFIGSGGDGEYARALADQRVQTDLMLNA